jgi:hypothetical protein
MRLHRTLPLAAAVLLAACQAGDATAPTLAPADARMEGSQTGGSGGYTGTSGTSTTSGTETTTTQSTDSTTVTGRGVNMGGSGN